MTTDNKTLADECNCPNGRAEHMPTCASLRATLADVQPGGTVRLGDAPWPEIDAILADAYSAGAEGLPFEGIARRAAVRKAVAVLSAQPSPGGQHGVWMLPDDARIVGVIADSIERGKLDHPGFYRNTQLGEVLRRVLSAALASRQPVGEPTAWMTHHDEPMLFPTAAEAAAYCEDDEQPVPLFRPPAQAVDLERFRGTVKSQYSMTEWMHRCGFVSAEKLEESKKNHDHLMALIDSQAVGNG
ncbi:hypothetical protein [Stenotrophomonas maltophilia]|uniref:hypothetical protein n=1 Tax=Stenotrophomonas maltophilia TaxID=40324 RepID=UPI000DA923B5|nr:hypothetical protein [Stenotrophomonas maltophilia]PZS51590.1 hypothetical protein A7X60_02485 [Stenotrophomonas maltophilia]